MLTFRHFLESTEQLWYHGSRRPWDEIGGTKQSFGGIHLGTKKAAIDRLESTPSQRPRGIPGPCKIYACQVNLRNPFNSPEDPASEHQVFMWVSFPKDEVWQGIIGKYDGIYYENSVEDPGSISLLVFDKKKIQMVGEEEVVA